LVKDGAPPGGAAPESLMDIDEAPLLHEPDLMLAVLRVASGRVGTLDACIEHLRRLRDCAKVEHRVPEAAVRPRLETAAAKLERAGLIERAGQRFRITPHGRKLLADHPGGIDDSVLNRSEAGRAPGREPTAALEPLSPRISEYDAGYQAHAEGQSLADNPHPRDVSAHLDWQNGWSEARDQAARRRHGPQASSSRAAG
jgi:hypothetical protein